MTSTVIYQGDLRTVATHLSSGTVIETDAPLDNQGKAERFSPTDLVATALASCMATIMGISARNHGWNIDGAAFEITKVMASDPRRIGEIIVKVKMPKDQYFDAKQKQVLERAGLTCPVIESLHPALKKSITFYWP